MSKSLIIHSGRESDTHPGTNPRSEEPFLLTSPLLESYSSISHTFTTRRGGTSPPPFNSLNLSGKTGDSKENVIENISILKDKMEIKGELFLLNQVHGNSILVVDDQDMSKENDLKFDAVITNKPDIPLAILTADCLPLLIYDPSKSVIGAVHAGWRGTAGHISRNTIEKMISCFGSAPADIIVAMGPVIRPCCYEVDERLFEAFKNSGYNWDEISSKSTNKSRGRWMLDIAGANLLDLTRAGIRRENISQVPHCTACRSDLFYSHRRDGNKSGREAAVIMLNS